jgi:hypothetical protein
MATPTTLSSTIATAETAETVTDRDRRRDEGVAMYSPANNPGEWCFAALVVAGSTRQNDLLVVART